MGSRGMQRQIRVWRPRARRAISAYLKPIIETRLAAIAEREAQIAMDPRYAGLTGLMPTESPIADIIGTWPTGTIGGRAR